jgi:uncharacterized membrane protein
MTRTFGIKVDAVQTTHHWTPLITAHVAIALAALVIGAVLLKGHKGTVAHRVGGWLWVLCMATVAVVSLAIYGPNGFSWIHGLSVFTLFMLASGVLSARAHRVRQHRLTMTSIYFGALVITGLFTLMPSRLIGGALWGLLSL